MDEKGSIFKYSMNRRIGLSAFVLIVFSHVAAYGQSSFDECKTKTKIFDFKSESFDNTSGNPKVTYYGAFFGKRMFRTLNCSEQKDTIHLEVTTKGSEYLPKSKRVFFVESTGYHYPLSPPTSPLEYFSEKPIDIVDSIVCRVEKSWPLDFPVNGGVICSQSNLTPPVYYGTIEPFAYYGTKTRLLSQGWASHSGSRSGPSSYYIDSILTFEDYGIAKSRHFGGYIRSFFGDSVYSVFEYSLSSVDSQSVDTDKIDQRWNESQTATNLKRLFMPFSRIHPRKTSVYDASGRNGPARTIPYAR